MCTNTRVRQTLSRLVLKSDERTKNCGTPRELGDTHPIANRVHSPDATLFKTLPRPNLEGGAIDSCCSWGHFLKSGITETNQNILCVMFNVLLYTNHNI